MLFVMFGISVLVFLIFFATPGADPAARIAGRNASPETLAGGAQELRPRSAAAGAVCRDDDASCSSRSDLTSFVNRGWKVVPAVMRVIPGDALAGDRRARYSGWWAASLIGLVAAATRGSLLDRALMILGLIGISMPVFWLGEVMNLLTPEPLPRHLAVLLGAAARLQAAARRIPPAGS